MCALIFSYDQPRGLVVRVLLIMRSGSTMGILPWGGGENPHGAHGLGSW
jgi:hypothetical protein